MDFEHFGDASFCNLTVLVVQIPQLILVAELVQIEVVVERLTQSLRTVVTLLVCTHEFLVSIFFNARFLLFDGHVFKSFQEVFSDTALPSRTTY